VTTWHIDRCPNLQPKPPISPLRLRHARRSALPA